MAISEKMHPSLCFAGMQTRRSDALQYPHSSGNGSTLTFEMLDSGANDQIFGMDRPIRKKPLQRRELDLLRIANVADLAGRRPRAAAPLARPDSSHNSGAREE